MSKDFQVKMLAPNEPVELTPHVAQYKPVYCYVLPNGSIEDKTSFAIVMTHPIKQDVIGQISLKMLLEGFAEAGIDLTKLT